MVTNETGLVVREMKLADVGLRIDYFHDASDEYLLALGVERTFLPSRDAWRTFYEEDYQRPLEERLNFSLLWLLDDETIGFSSTDRITYGEEAFMHLHLTDAARRQRGLGTQFLRLSVDAYFEKLRLTRLFCEPNAFNVAPNRALQRAGFRYLFTHEARPSEINFAQSTTRWVMDRSSATSESDRSDP